MITIKMRVFVIVSVALAPPILERANGFSVQETRAPKGFREKDASAPPVKSMLIMNSKEATSAIKDRPNSPLHFLFLF